MKDNFTAQDAGELYGYGKYPKLTEKQKTIIAFGMTPIEILEEAERGMRGMIDACDRPYYRKGVVLGLMKAAKEKNLMIV